MVLQEKPLKVLITGISGFVGYHLATKCLTEGMSVHGIAKQTSDNIHRLESFDKFSFTVADISIADDINKAFQEPVDIIYHLAGQPYVWYANSNPQTDFNTNAVGTINLLERARQVGAGKIIFASTGEVYEESSNIDEESGVKPTNFYGLSKWVAENYIRLYSRYFSLRYTILRFSLIYGPYFKRNVLFDILNGLSKEDKKIQLYTNLNSEYDLVFVEDAVDAFFQACNKAWDGKTLNISSGKGILVRDMVDTLCKLSHSEGKEIEYLTDNMVRKVFSNVRASELGWKQKHSFEAGVARTLEWWQKQIPE
jgi:UDP-glucose 4-epimerase